MAAVEFGSVSGGPGAVADAGIREGIGAETQL